jgi:hypothetical protein
MFDYSTKIYKQALIVLDSSFGALELPPALIPGSYFGSGYSKVALYEPSLMDSMNTTMDMESQITRTIFSGAPVLWNSDLSQGYQELGEALGEITELDELRCVRTNEDVFPRTSNFQSRAKVDCL